MIRKHLTHLLGFTLIELLITMVVTGVLAAALAANINARNNHSVIVQSELFRRNLSHLQMYAISRSARLQLAVTAGSYTVTCVSCTSPDITDPSTGENFSVSLTDEVAFTQGAGNYFFDSLGRPVTAATGGGLATGVSTFTLSGNGRSVNVSVLPITGFAQIAY